MPTTLFKRHFLCGRYFSKPDFFTRPACICVWSVFLFQLIIFMFYIRLSREQRGHLRKQTKKQKTSKSRNKRERTYVKSFCVSQYIFIRIWYYLCYLRYCIFENNHFLYKRDRQMNHQMSSDLRFVTVSTLDVVKCLYSPACRNLC